MVSVNYQGWQYVADTRRLIAKLIGRKGLGGSVWIHCAPRE